MYKYKYVIGESKDVSDRPPSTPGGGFLSYLNSPVHMCMLSVTGSREQQGQEIFFFRYIHMNRHALSIIEIFDLCPDFRLQPRLLQYITLGGQKKKARQDSRRLRSKKGRIEASRKPYCSYLHNYCRFIAFFSKCYCCVAKARTSSICRVLEQLGTLARRPQTQVWCSGSMKFRYETWRLRSGGVSCKAA